MALRRQRRARIVQEEDESSWLFGNEQIIKLLHFLSYLKWANNFTLPKNIITDFRLARVLCDLHCMMNKSLTPYLHCTRLRCITAPQPPELICHAVGSFWSVSLRCITKDRHLVYFWQIIIIIVSCRQKTSATGIIFDYHRYTILLSISTLNRVVKTLRFLAIMYSLENDLLSNVCWM